MDNVSKFLEKYPISSVERVYFRACFDLIFMAKLDWSKEALLSLVSLFQERQIELHDGRIIGNPDSIMGTVTDVCDILSVAFPNISDNPTWWRSEYWSVDEKILNKAKEKLVKHLLSNKIVKSVV